MSATNFSAYYKSTLPELAAKEPEIWTQVMKQVRFAVEQKRFEQLADLSQKAQAAMARWMAAAESPIASTQHAHQEFVAARMTVLAVEQFIAAFTGANSTPSPLDHLQLRLRILPRLERGHLFSTLDFDKLWNTLTEKAGATFAIQKSGFWSVPSKEACEGILTYAKGRPILEIGSGRGLYVAALRNLGAEVQGVDDCSWDMARNVIKPAQKYIRTLSANEALQSQKPSVVLSVWPTPGNTFEKEIFAARSVDVYMTIVSKHRFASGNWTDYKLQDANPKGFSCITNEALNKSLRPVEADQQIFIFRRK